MLIREVLGQEKSAYVARKGRKSEDKSRIKMNLFAYSIDFIYLLESVYISILFIHFTFKVPLGKFCQRHVLGS